MKKGISILLVLLTLCLMACGKQAKEKNATTESATTENATEEGVEEVDMSPPDNRSYDWAGDYLDSTGGQALLTIEPNPKRNKGYAILIYIPAGEDAYSTWSCTGIYDETLGGLHYEDCVRTNMDTGEAGNVEVAYQKGTGVIIPSAEGSDTLLWIDDQDRRGVDLRFQRTAEEK